MENKVKESCCNCGFEALGKCKYGEECSYLKTWNWEKGMWIPIPAYRTDLIEEALAKKEAKRQKALRELSRQRKEKAKQDKSKKSK